MEFVYNQKKLSLLVITGTEQMDGDPQQQTCD